MKLAEELPPAAAAVLLLLFARRWYSIVIFFAAMEGGGGLLVVVNVAEVGRYYLVIILWVGVGWDSFFSFVPERFSCRSVL